MNTMKKFLIFIFILFVSCDNSARIEDKLVVAELTNNVLKENIIAYANERFAEAEEFGGYLEPARYKLLTLAYQSDKNGNRIYKLDLAGLGFIFCEPHPIFLTKVDDLYVAYYEKGNTDFQLSIEAMVNILQEDFPDFKSGYKKYLDNVEKSPDYLPLLAFRSVLWEGNYWILKFSGDRLISKIDIDEVSGTKKEYHYD